MGRIDMRSQRVLGVERPPSRVATIGRLLLGVGLLVTVPLAGLAWFMMMWQARGGRRVNRTPWLVIIFVLVALSLLSLIVRR